MWAKKYASLRGMLVSSPSLLGQADWNSPDAYSLNCDDTGRHLLLQKHPKNLAEYAWHQI
jgi:hypothetical protein